MEELLSETQKALFQYDIVKASQNLVEIFDALAHLEQNFDIDQTDQFKETLQTMNLALLKQDYLLIADLLEYVIQPLVNSTYQ